MIIIGLTGGIATGKSTVSRHIKELGIDVIDADEISREVVEPGTTGYQRIIKVFGPEIIDRNTQRINRDALGQIIFSDTTKRRQLNSITHPLIIREIIMRCLKCFWNRKSYVVLDLPLLFEVGTFNYFLTCIMVVKCSPEQQMQRLMDRNNLTEEEAKSRIDAQMSLDIKCSRADFIIDNSYSLSETKSSVDKLFKDRLKEKFDPRMRYLKIDMIVATTIGIMAWTTMKIFNIL